jgi:hypothetical protein
MLAIAYLGGYHLGLMLGLEWSSRMWSCKAKSDDEQEMAETKEAHAELPFSTKPYQNTGDPVRYQ